MHRYALKHTPQARGTTQWSIRRKCAPSQMLRKLSMTPGLESQNLSNWHTRKCLDRRSGQVCLLVRFGVYSSLELLCSYQHVARHTSGRKPTF